jgi:hypothetical protein
LINAFNEIYEQSSSASRRACVLVAVLALFLSPCTCAAAGGSGRDGGSERGCNAVTDSQGAAVSGREGGVSVSTRWRRDCVASESSAASPGNSAERPPSKPAIKPPLAPLVVQQRAPVSVLSGQVSVPAGAVETPSALGGDVVRAGATVVTSGVMIWLLQSSLLASLLVLGVPIWRHVDLLAVVSNPDDAALAGRADAFEPEDATLTHVLEAGSAPPGAGHPRSVPG